MFEKKDSLILAEYETESDLLKAAEKIKDLGYRNWDTHSPYPIHGMDDAMGLKKSKLGWLSFIFGMIGASGAFLLQWWISVHAYPLVISGKPLNSYPAFIPITFEGGILFTALATVFGMLFLNRLPQWYHVLFLSQRFQKATDNGFFISLEAKDPQYDREFLTTFVKEIGAVYVEVVQDDE